MARTAAPNRDGGADCNELSMALDTPGMTALHKAGLAGLWLTLEHFERHGIALPGDWERSPTGLVLRWGEEGPGPFFQELIKESFRIDSNGLIWFPPLGEPTDHPGSAILLQEALLSTFLQHGRTRDADPSNRRGGSITVQMDEDNPVPLPAFQRVRWYAHQNAAKNLMRKDGALKPQPVVGWLLPGGIVRHNAFQRQSALLEPPSRWLSLVYAPIGSIYFRVRSRRSGVRPQFALVLPEIRDLEAYGAARRNLVRMQYSVLTVSGTAEAGWRLLALATLEERLQAFDIQTCRVVAFGTVAWAPQQKTRVEVLQVDRQSDERVAVYQQAFRYLGPRPVHPREGEPFIYISPVLELISRNLTNSKSWYNEFSELVTDPASRGSVMNYDRGRLHDMVMKAPCDQSERVFVQACHEAWRARFRQLFDRECERLGVPSLPEGEMRQLVRRERERFRSAITRCKNAAAVREVITDFWARSGTLPALRQHWTEVLPLLSGQHWRAARDLALLALVSYASEHAGDGDEDEPKVADGTLDPEVDHQSKERAQ
jgi:CRISPR-associated protein Cas8a1/Csx13